MHAIESELIQATGYKTQRKFSNRQDYLGSILNAAIKLEDADYDALTDGAKGWYNAAIEAKNEILYLLILLALVDLHHHLNKSNLYLRNFNLFLPIGHCDECTSSSSSSKISTSIAVKK